MIRMRAMGPYLITNVRILDGTGRDPFNGAVRVEGNQIAEVSWGAWGAPGAPHVQGIPTSPMYAPQACSGVTSIACSPVFRIPRVGGGSPWSAIHFAAASMLLVR